MSEAKYAISVVTPFHNVDMRYFREAVRSMREQTIGYGNVQWVIVLHNCEPKYRPILEEMLGKDPNVVLADLDDGTHTPSAPRNRGVELATAKYVGYLDGDDSYHPTCLAECVRNAEETGAQVVCFRRDFELESESLGAMTEMVLWNQLERRIVIERGDWERMQRIFDGLFSFVTSKVFDRAFLLRKGIAFDPEIPYCEDSIYSMTAIAEADRVCVLPQLIGYHYFINGASLVQSSAKDSKTVVAYARGLAKIFAQGYDLGIDINYFTQRLMLHVCRFMLHSEMAPEDREEIKRLFAPFIYRTTPVAPNKIVTREWSNYAFNMCREVILNTESYRDNRTLMELSSGLQNLQRILDGNRESDFGRKYQFANLRTIAAYRHHVPLSRLASYRKFIDLQVNIGERGILTSDEITGYVRAGDGIVPFTAAHAQPYLRAVASILKGHHNLWVAQCELAGRPLNDNTRIHSLGSVIVREYFFRCVYGGGRRPATFSAPDNTFFTETERENDYYVILHHALLDRSVDQIVAADAGRIARMFRLLLDDRTSVLSWLRAEDAVRADEVAVALEEFDAGDEGKFARRLWPDLSRVVACGTTRFSADREFVRRFTGDVPWNNGVLLLPELVLAHAEGDGSDRYIFDGTDCFCEFFRNDSDEVETPVTMSELMPGHTYNVIVTNGAGLYRVVTDAEIRIISSEIGNLVVDVML